MWLVTAALDSCKSSPISRPQGGQVWPFHRWCNWDPKWLVPWLSARGDFSPRGQPGTVLIVMTFPRWDIRVEARHAAKYSTRHRAAPHNKEQFKDTSSARGEVKDSATACVRYSLVILSFLRSLLLLLSTLAAVAVWDSQPPALVSQPFPTVQQVLPNRLQTRRGEAFTPASWEEVGKQVAFALGLCTHTRARMHTHTRTLGVGSSSDFHCRPSLGIFQNLHLSLWKENESTRPWTDATSLPFLVCLPSLPPQETAGICMRQMLEHPQGCFKRMSMQPGAEKTPGPCPPRLTQLWAGRLVLPTESILETHLSFLSLPSF